MDAEELNSIQIAKQLKKGKSGASLIYGILRSRDLIGSRRVMSKTMSCFAESHFQPDHYFERALFNV